MSWAEGLGWLLVDVVAFTLLAVPVWWLLDHTLRFLCDHGF